ncbi:N-methyl-L-tryptophan oxidase [Corynebacterium terpenotabidum]|uniref:N-methyltryptophan oxidase n=1 Tax=Corynebacterium terpenotabidum Y-11 TaxID=1200352 RepID=S4XDP8_9CORY|nr:N-methyl-L-tryptophan oxidase [Corynebacterium terpenotabidum]AGP31277.1 N-methyltryptophan oxidase [Corynebacterium terpenotabidum Y-11]
MSHWDVIIIGTGSMGGAAANALAERGVNVLGLETFEPGHEQGAAHGGTRIIRQSYFESPDYVPLLRRSYELFRKLEEESGREIMELCGGIYIGDPESLTFAGSKLAAELHNLEHEVLTADEIRTRFPTMDPADDALGLYEANAGYVRPEETTIANAEVAARKGATLHFHEKVTGWTITDDGGVEVTTDTPDGPAVYTADKLIVSPGAWAPVLLPELNLPLQIDRMLFHWFTPDYTDKVPAEAWSEENHPVYIEQTHDNDQIYGFPATDGPDGGFKLGFFRNGSPTTADTIDRTVYDHEVEEMRARALELFPALTGPLVQAKTCLYSVTPDEHFVVGPHPDHPQVIVACGFSGHGFKFVPVIGEILADLAIDGTTRHNIDLFDPSRFRA